MSTSQKPQPTPILLLKTKSTPTDSYEDYFAHADRKPTPYNPIFIPVLEHAPKNQSLERVRELLQNEAFIAPGGSTHSSHHGPNEKQKQAGRYGGLIFTSQRAVEAFAGVLLGLTASSTMATNTSSTTPKIPIYVVGPATARALRALPLLPPRFSIVGEETGNGEVLAAFILEHYNALWSTTTTTTATTTTNTATTTTTTQQHDNDKKPPLLFLVGDKRRDIIPKTLQSTTTPSQRIAVHELEVYETRERVGFKEEFAAAVACHRGSKNSVKKEGEAEEEEGEIEDTRIPQWVVLFSPTGCKAVLEVLGYDLNAGSGEDDGVERKGKRRKGNTYLAAIGPTTGDYLCTEFGVEPEVRAARPSAEGVGEAIERFLGR